MGETYVFIKLQVSLQKRVDFKFYAERGFLTQENSLAQPLSLSWSGKRANAFINLRNLEWCLLHRREQACLRELTHNAARHLGPPARRLLVVHVRVSVLFGTAPGTLKICSVPCTSNLGQTTNHSISLFA